MEVLKSSRYIAAWPLNANQGNISDIQKKIAGNLVEFIIQTVIDLLV